MNKIIYTAIFGLFYAASAPALAQSANSNSEISPAEAFSGAHIEATIGWEQLGAKLQIANQTAAGIKHTRNGFTYGAAAGYDLALSENVTGGAEVGIYGSSAKWNNASIQGTATLAVAPSKSGRDIYVGARFGYAFDNRTSLFLKGGYTNHRLEVVAATTNNTTNLAFNANGFRLGAGLEKKLSRSTYAKLEYDYSHYANVRFTALSSPSTIDLTTDRHQILTSVGIRF